MLKDHNTVTPVRLEPAALRSRVKHSTTEPLRSQILQSKAGFQKIWYHCSSYSKRSKISSNFLFLFSSKITVLRMKFTKCLQNSKQENPDQTASSEAVWSGSALFVSDLGLPCLSMPFLQATSVQNFRTFTVLSILQDKFNAQKIMYSRTSMAQTLMTQSPGLARTIIMVSMGH